MTARGIFWAGIVLILIAVTAYVISAEASLLMALALWILYTFAADTAWLIGWLLANLLWYDRKA